LFAATAGWEIIVCGYGRLGIQVVEELQGSQIDFLVIEKNQNAVERLQKSGILYLQGDATEDQMLIDAGIKRATGLLITTPKDSDNLFITLSARGLNPRVKIIVRAEEEACEVKLLRAGADQVVHPFRIMGHRMADLVLNPEVVNLFEIVARDKKIALKVTELPIDEYSSFRQKSLAELYLESLVGILVVGMRKSSGEVIMNPDSSVILEDGDVLIVIGEPSVIRNLR